MHLHSCLTALNLRSRLNFSSIDSWLKAPQRIEEFQILWSYPESNPLVAYEEGLIDQILKRNDEESFFREFRELFLPNHRVAIMYSFTENFGADTPFDAF